jgi:hypothetical protein
MARLGVAAQVICVATVSNKRGFFNMIKLHMTRLRSSPGVEMLEHFMRISIEGPAIGTPSVIEKLLRRAVNHQSGLRLKRRRMDWDWEVPIKLVLAQRAREVKQNAWKKDKQDAGKAEEMRKIGFSGTSSNRHEIREARKKAAATDSAEAEATIAADFDAAIADKVIDKSALDAMALKLSRPSMAQIRWRSRRKSNWLTPTSSCC